MIKIDRYHIKETDNITTSYSFMVFQKKVLLTLQHYFTEPKQKPWHPSTFFNCLRTVFKSEGGSKTLFYTTIKHVLKAFSTLLSEIQEPYITRSAWTILNSISKVIRTKKQVKLFRAFSLNRTIVAKRFWRFHITVWRHAFRSEIKL